MSTVNTVSVRGWVRPGQVTHMLQGQHRPYIWILTQDLLLWDNRAWFNALHRANILVTPLKVDCGISKRYEILQTDFLQRQDPITVPSSNLVRLPG